MYKLLTINDFRQFKNVSLLLGRRMTVLAGRNATGKIYYIRDIVQ